MSREKEEGDPKMANQGICLKCRRLLPAGSFARNVTGNLTAWCSVCREDCAKNWGVDPDMVEFVHAMYVFEQTLKSEALTVQQAKVNLGQLHEKEMAALRNRIHGYHIIRHSRIRDRLRNNLQEFRAAFYTGIGMEAPEVVYTVPAGG